VEVVTSVDVVGQDAGLEGAGQAASRDTALIRSSRVGECDARRPRAALGSLVDVG
jgi:hypothetical protein